MAEPLRMLALSPTMETGTIARWLKKEGDSISSGDVICEVETDKATMEYEATFDATLLKILLPEGGQAKVGDVIGVIGQPGENIDELLKEIKVSSGAQREAKAEEPKGQSPEPTPVSVPSQPVPAEAAPVPAGERVKASPVARKLAAEHGLDLRLVKGSGPGGRIIKQDVEKALAAGIPATVASAVLPQQDVEIPVSEKRKVIARRLAESKYSAPHYYLTLSVEMDELIAARKRIIDSLGRKISMNAFLIKFVAEALRKHPEINSTWMGDKIVRHASIDIGLAVAQPDGLITPVVRNCASKGILDIEQELQVLIEKALANKLQPQEYTGATFTISNLGSFGIEEFTAIINPPGSAILAIGQVMKTPVVKENDQIVIRQLMKMTMSCDHRIIDGAVGARFLKNLKDMMEDPVRTLL